MFYVWIMWHITIEDDFFNHSYNEETLNYMFRFLESEYKIGTALGLYGKI